MEVSPNKIVKCYHYMICIFKISQLSRLIKLNSQAIGHYRMVLFVIDQKFHMVGTIIHIRKCISE